MPYRWPVCVALLAALAAPAPAAPPRKPNLVFILTDNHGAWTLGCYGSRDIRTPHIDRLASEGMLFTRCFACNGVCSPTRASLLTGLLPSQHGVHCFLRAGAEQIGPESVSTIREFGNLPRILADSGYVCGLSGKWHLGGNLRPQEGFTSWITMPHGATSTFYDAEVIEDGKIRKEATYLTDLWTRHACKFISENQRRPFFLFLAYNGPYGLGRSLLQPARNRHAAYYADRELPSFPREKMHPWLFNNKEYLNNPRAIRRVAAEVSGVDDGVGEVLGTLKKLGLEEDTLVVFTGDQGWAGGQQGIWGMGDHTRPLHAFDTTTHVPLLARLPGVIPAGKKSDLMVSSYDFLPTLLDMLGLGEKMPTKPASPGHSFAGALRGREIAWDNVVYYDFENTRAVRTEKWKYVHRFPDGPDELYDLEKDPRERNNLIDDPAQADRRRELRARLEAFFKKYADPKYDLKHGGRSKTRRLVGAPGR